MTDSDLVAALRPVADALDALGVRYYLGGSVAVTQDADRTYLGRWADSLGVADLLERALADAAP